MTTHQPLSLFISSKMQELANERQTVLAALRDYCIYGWIWENDAGARPEPIRSTYLKEVETCDIYLGLFWLGYGSYTIEEFDHAHAQNKPCLIYEKHVRVEERSQELTEFLGRFQQVASTDGLTVCRFETPEQLASQVQTDVMRLLTTIFRNYRQKPALPKVWNIPYCHNPYFTGREDMLQVLHEHLIAAKSTALTQAISGPGGIGKTQTAATYAYRYRQYYDSVLWLQADSWEDLASASFRLADQLGLPEQQEMDEAVAKVQDWLRKHRDWLLILDNVENPQEILPKIVPTDHRGSVLMTTLIDDIEPLAQTQKLAPMSEEEAILFLLRRTKTIAATDSLEKASDEHYNEARQIYLLMDGLPLALDQAGAYILETGCSLARYLDLYRQSHKQCLARRGKYAIDHVSVYATFALAFRRIRRTNIVASELLYLLAFLSPDDIPEDLITQAAPQLGYATRLALHFDPFALDTARSLLLSSSLLSRYPSNDAFHMHRLVQVVLKDWLARRHLQYVELAVQVVNKVFPEKAEIQDWSTCRRYLPHAFVCRGLVEQERLVLFDAAELFPRAGLYCTKQALYSDAQRFFEQALRIIIEIFGQEGPHKAPLLHNLGVLAHTDGRIDEAQHFFEQALTLLEGYPVPGSDDAKHRVLRNIALVFYEQGKEEEAEQLLQRLINERETWAPSEQPDGIVARMLQDMGYLRRKQGRYQEAERHLQRALHIQENAPSSTDPADIANTLHELANLYQILDNEREAESLYRRSIAISESIYESDHPDIAPTLQSLATLLLYSGKEREGEAKQHFARAVHITEQTFGGEHPRTIEIYDEYYECFGEEYPTICATR